MSALQTERDQLQQALAAVSTQLDTTRKDLSTLQTAATETATAAAADIARLSSDLQSVTDKLAAADALKVVLSDKVAQAEAVAATELFSLEAKLVALTASVEDAEERCADHCAQRHSRQRRWLPHCKTS